MKLREIHAIHFRSLRDVSVAVGPVTALIGGNGSGKSNILHALNFFYSQSYPVTAECFFDRQTATPCSVTLTFDDLTAQEREWFGAYLDADTLSITKEATFSETGAALARYYGSRLQCPDFDQIRAITGAKERAAAYNALVENATHPGLARARAVADADQTLLAWEAEHPDRCVRARDSGQFFGWTNVGHGKIDQFSKWIFIPAVREASADGGDDRGSALRSLLDLFLRAKLTDHPELKKLREETAQRYKEILDPQNLEDLQRLSHDITVRLQQFSPSSAVEIGWRSLDGVSIPLPAATTQIREGGFTGPVEYAGHGTQRAFLIAMLQFAAHSRIAVEQGHDANPHILLGIEEPELYLHPVRARLMSRVLHALSAAPEGTLAIQSIYATHSPHFVNIASFSNVRLVRRPEVSGSEPAHTLVAQADAEPIARELAVVYEEDPKKFTETTLQVRLIRAMTPVVAEGFFSDAVVLVEGQEDLGLIAAGADLQGYDLEELGISVLPVGGKSSLALPLVVFRSLGIPCFVVFDADGVKKSDKKANRALLRLMGQPVVDYPDTATWPTGACFADTFQQEISRHLGGDYAAAVAATAQSYGIKAERADKNPVVVREALKSCCATIPAPPVLAGLLTHIVSLVRPVVGPTPNAPATEPVARAVA